MSTKLHTHDLLSQKTFLPRIIEFKAYLTIYHVLVSFGLVPFDLSASGTSRYHGVFLFVTYGEFSTCFF